MPVHPGAVVAIVVVAGSALALPIDVDRDGLNTVQEWRHGGAVFSGDRDGDGLVDGDEVAHGLRPDRADTDGDGLDDGLERRLGADGTSVDSDGDGIPDGVDGQADCDQDGWLALVDSDDDADGRPDGDEPAADRCLADADGDGVLDGDEGRPECTRRTDCDADGLADGAELLAGYDPLDPDTFDAGLLDGVVRAFEEAGQPPARDDDRDGIPDAWESSQGLIDWGVFDPRPGRPDLMVEFLKVTGPQSGRFSLDMRPAYDAVAGMFAEQGIALQWTETQVRLDAEHRPGFLEEDDLGYYRGVLDAGQATQNPYVTSIVLNPQQTQEDLAGDVLGATFLRAMVVTVDYGAHVEVAFQEADADGLTLTGGLSLSPSLESHILGAPRQQVRQIQFASEGIVDLGPTARGVFMVTRQDGTDFRWDWRNDWFRTAPNITLQDGRWLQLRTTGAALDTATLATTIAHEVGHTLGLCHTHEEECYQDLPFEEAVARHQSTMSYGAAPGTLAFLPSEWAEARALLACPPQGPLTVLAQGGGADALFAEKYEISFKQEASQRACGDHAPLERLFQPAEARHVDASWTPSGAPTSGIGWGLTYLAGVAAAAVLAVRATRGPR